MKLLLDTHALIWWTLGMEQLSTPARRAIEEAELVFVSAVSAMEIATKHRLGKLAEAERLAVGFHQVIGEHGFGELPLTIAHATTAGRLTMPHKDPFDRMLIAQASIEGMTLVSNEQRFDTFGVARHW